jgi:predicted nucleotidyltransferase
MDMVEDIKDYILKLTKKYPAIKSIWLFGSRANNSSLANSDWDLLAFGDENTLNMLKADKSFCDEIIDLFIVYNGNDAENPFPDIKNGNKASKTLSLSNLQWKQEGSDKAKYRHVKYKSENEWFKNDEIEVKILDAHKIWPP